MTPIIKRHYNKIVDNNIKKLIYTVEDDTAIRELIVYALRQEKHNVQEFDNAVDMLYECDKQLPDLILLDVMLPQLDGISALKKFRDKFNTAHTRIIMVSAKSDEIHKLQGLDAGADDYITKPFSILELSARVRANLRKSAQTSAPQEVSILYKNGIALCSNSRKVTINDRAIKLTGIEFALLKELMLKDGEVIERDVLFKKVWGTDYFGERTIDMHIKNLREKLGGVKHCIKSERGIGYVMTTIDV